MFSLTTDQELQILAIIVSACIVGWQIKSAKKLEIDFKVHEQRKEQYNDLTSLIKKIFAASKNNPSDITNAFNPDEWFDVNFGMSMYASEKVFKAYRRMMKIQEEEEKIMIVKRLGDLILLMRKEVGLEDSHLTSREVLSTVINDIDSHEYDKYFK